jgi:hypothetical protein
MFKEIKSSIWQKKYVWLLNDFKGQLGLIKLLRNRLKNIKRGAV